ncbi:unnamed protein product [Clonostachys solani]|uniref:Uncharacterized protein n=1 Tax=Clonostachys solani TaxID=160281 RepID=A0A9P0ESB9_9HYPO|nr:unnamed protein product [Clonostachys solani]
MAVMEKEDEKDVDILDVLVQTTPGATMKIASPHRESYNLALPLLPKYNNDLLELQIPTAKLAAFLKLVGELEPGRESSLAKLTEDLEGSEGISYEVFNTMLSTYSELLFDALMNIFWSLQM